MTTTIGNPIVSQWTAKSTSRLPGGELTVEWGQARLIVIDASANVDTLRLPDTGSQLAATGAGIFWVYNANATFLMNLTATLDSSTITNATIAAGKLAVVSLYPDSGSPSGFTWHATLHTAVEG